MHWLDGNEEMGQDFSSLFFFNLMCNTKYGNINIKNQR